MMYQEYFGLQDEPFRLMPDPHYLYPSRGHGRARAYLDYSLVSREGFVVITGEIGSGKTLMLRHLLEELPAHHHIVHIDQTQLTPVEFLQAVYLELRGEVATTSNKIELLEQLRILLAHAWSRNMRVIVAIDEAQALSREVLEEVRMLSGAGTAGERQFSIILLGQPELDRMLDQPEMEQLRQRIRLRFHLDGLGRDEIGAYIHRRLSVAGAAEPEALIGGDDVLDCIHEYTGGIPRLINTLCEMALLVACVDQKPGVDRQVLDDAIAELGWQLWQPRPVAAGQGGSVAPIAPPSAALTGSDGSAAVETDRIAALARLADVLDRIDTRLERIADALDGKVVPLHGQHRGSK